MVMDHLQRSKLEIGILSREHSPVLASFPSHGQGGCTIDSWAPNNASPRTNTERMTVAMLSEQLHIIDPPAPVSLLSHPPGDTNTKEMAAYNATRNESG